MMYAPTARAIHDMALEALRELRVVLTETRRQHPDDPPEFRIRNTPGGVWEVAIPFRGRACPPMRVAVAPYQLRPGAWGVMVRLKPYAAVIRPEGGTRQQPFNTPENLERKGVVLDMVRSTTLRGSHPPIHVNAELTLRALIRGVVHCHVESDQIVVYMDTVRGYGLLVDFVQYMSAISEPFPDGAWYEGIAAPAEDMSDLSDG